MIERDSIEYWKGCYNRVEAADTMSKLLILGKIKQLQSQIPLRKPKKVYKKEK